MRVTFTLPAFKHQVQMFWRGSLFVRAVVLPPEGIQKVPSNAMAVCPADFNYSLVGGSCLFDYSRIMVLSRVIHLCLQ